MILAELKDALEKDYVKISKKIALFYSDEVAGSPVDTGHYKEAWTMRNKGLVWVLENPMKYAETLWRGRRFVDDMWYGSEQGLYAEPISIRLRRLENALDEL